MRDRYIVSANLLILATAGACTAPSRSQPSATLAARVDSLFHNEVRPGEPGCAVGIYRNGEIILTRAYGVTSIESGRAITSHSTFNLGSASKPFTSIAALMLERRGKLEMDDDVRHWVPELPDADKKIRVRDLLQHTSGLRDFGTLEQLAGRSVTTQTQFLALIASQRALNFEPSTRHEYSHTDFGILGLIVERIAGVPFSTHLAKTVFAPMGMKESFVDDLHNNASTDRAFGHLVTPQGPSVLFPHAQTFGGDNVYSSVEDLVHWDRTLDQPTNDWAPFITRMTTLPTLPSGDTIPYAYGLRLGTYRGLRTIGRRGHPPGSWSVFLRFPEQRFTVTTLCNSDALDASRLAERVADIYEDTYLVFKQSAPNRRPTPPQAVTMSSSDLARFTGTYRSIDDPWSVGRIELRQGVLGEVLFEGSTDDAFYPMTPAGDDRFFEVGRTGNVGIFTFRSSSSGSSLLLESSWNDGPISRSERIDESAVWRPSSAALAEYAGTWFSADLDASWQLETRGTRLVLRRRGLDDFALGPVTRDRFVRGFGVDGELSVRMQFHRDRAGKVSELTVSTPPGEDAVRDVRFVRLAFK